MARKGGGYKFEKRRKELKKQKKKLKKLERRNKLPGEPERAVPEESLPPTSTLD